MIDHCFCFCLRAIVHTFDQLTFSFGVIALVYTLHLQVSSRGFYLQTIPGRGARPDLPG
jgi:hypothetical protein